MDVTTTGTLIGVGFTVLNTAISALLARHKNETAKVIASEKTDQAKSAEITAQHQVQRAGIEVSGETIRALTNRVVSLEKQNESLKEAREAEKDARQAEHDAREIEKSECAKKIAALEKTVEELVKKVAKLLQEKSDAEDRAKVLFDENAELRDHRFSQRPQRAPLERAHDVVEIVNIPEGKK